ncbi:hypothetical protein NE451_21810, partial [Bacteroides nordii]|uniref:glycoside hydrolase family 78 protein n=1 Tax=Bacteroides nordii TaxID=291645 RepID=UPI00210B1BE1
LVTPLGVDVPTPRFIWILPAHLNKKQAYQVIVGTDSVEVANGTGGAWDSRKILSTEVLTAYAGKAMQPYTR